MPGERADKNKTKKETKRDIRGKKKGLVERTNRVDLEVDTRAKDAVPAINHEDEPSRANC